MSRLREAKTASQCGGCGELILPGEPYQHNLTGMNVCEGCLIADEDTEYQQYVAPDTLLDRELAWKERHGY